MRRALVALRVTASALVALRVTASALVALRVTASALVARRARTAALVALLVLVLGHAAHAQDVELPKTLAHLTLPDDWTAVRAQGVVAAFKRGDGAVLAVTRAEVPNPDAWSGAKARREAYADQVAAGVKVSLTGTKRFAKKLSEMNNVPALDCEGTKDGAPVVVRVLLFRTYALSLAIELPKGADTKAIKGAKDLLAKFGPPKPVPRD